MHRARDVFCLATFRGDGGELRLAAGYYPEGVAVYDVATGEVVVEMEKGNIDTAYALTTYTGPSGERIVATDARSNVQVTCEQKSRPDVYTAHSWKKG
jgi:hypothetical protein